MRGPGKKGTWLIKPHPARARGGRPPGRKVVGQGIGFQTTVLLKSWGPRAAGACAYDEAMASTHARVQLRPVRLASYIALSAWVMACSTSTPGSMRAMPNDMVM